MSKTQLLKIATISLVLIGIVGLFLTERGLPRWLRRGPAGQNPAVLARDAEIARLRDRVADLQQQLAAERSAKLRVPEPDEEILAPAPVKPPALGPGASAALGWIRDTFPEKLGGITPDELRYLRELDLSSRTLSSDEIAHLSHLPSLKDLDLANTGLDDELVTLLAGLDGIERLVLDNNTVSDIGMSAVATLTGLRSLSLKGTAITDVGVAKLASLTQLRELVLDGTSVTDQALFPLRGLSLEVVGLGGTQVGDDGLGVLSHFKLRGLSLYHAKNVTDLGVEHLAGQTGLEELNLRGVSITSEGFAPLAQIAGLKKLNASLVASDAGVRHLRGLRSLEHLGLYGSEELTDEGIVHIGGLGALEVLQLQFTGITDAALKDLDGLNALRVLDVRGTEVTQAAATAFRITHPRCHTLR